MWGINKIVRNWKDTVASCLCCIYIWIKTQIFLLYANNWLHQLFMSPVEKIIKEKLIPALLDRFPISEDFRNLLFHFGKLGGMNIIDPTENSKDEYSKSRELAGQLTNSFKQKEHRYTASDENIKNCKSSIKKKRKGKHLYILTSLREQMPSKNKRLNNIAQKQGNSSWRTALPIKQLGFSLSKAQFWGAVYLQYWLPLKRLPSHCACSKFYIVHRALFCKKRLTWKCRWNVTGSQ